MSKVISLNSERSKRQIPQVKPVDDAVDHLIELIRKVIDDEASIEWIKVGDLSIEVHLMDADFEPPKDTDDISYPSVGYEFASFIPILYSRYPIRDQFDDVLLLLTIILAQVGITFRDYSYRHFFNDEIYWISFKRQDGRIVYLTIELP